MIEARIEVMNIESIYYLDRINFTVSRLSATNVSNQLSKANQVKTVNPETLFTLRIGRKA